MKSKQQSFSYITAAIAALKYCEVHSNIPNTVMSWLVPLKYSESVMNSASVFLSMITNIW